MLHLAADVAGYSRLMGADEEGTLNTLNLYRGVMTELIEEHQGRVIGTAGDSLLAEFGSAVQAVRSAVAVQRALDRRNADLDDARRMAFRIGINVGDVMVQGADLLGDGVNIAARLEQMAEPASIVVSGTVWEQIQGKLSFPCTYLGEQTVKNIARPVRAYRVAWDQTDMPGAGLAGAPAATELAGQALDRRSAIHQHGRRSRTGVFRRRYLRGHHHGAVEVALAVRDRAQFELYLQGPGRGC